MAIVYRHRRLDSNKIFYVGIGKDIKRAYSKIGRNKYWKSIVKNVGYSIEILFTNLSDEDACDLEIFLISQYGRKDLKTGILCNLTDGGEKGFNYKHTKESKEKIRNYRSGQNHSDLVKNKMSKISIKRSSNKSYIDKLKNTWKDGSRHKSLEENRDKIILSNKISYAKKCLQNIDLLKDELKEELLKPNDKIKRNGLRAKIIRHEKSINWYNNYLKQNNNV